MKIEKYICDRCGREIFKSSNKPSITLHKRDTELDLCGLCVTSFFNWYYKEENKEELQTTYDEEKLKESLTLLEDKEII